MARRFVVPVGLVALANNPAGTFAGETYFNTTHGKVRIFDGDETWLDAGTSVQDVAEAISGAALDSTDDLSEGTTNKYFSVQRVNDALNSGTLQNITFTYTQGVIDVSVPTVQGTTGTQGTTGAQGTQGTTGTQGPTGTQGTTGAQGTIGGTGTQGVEGTQGIQGVQGTLGSQGVAGTQGISGTQGATGTQGTDGTQGTNGSNGTQGTTGAQGIQGETGTAGLQGQAGTQGETGTQGAIGAQGTSGTQGTAGTQGTQGIQGYSGADGNSSSYYKYTADTSKTSGDPGSGGSLYWNNATQTSATVLVIDHRTSDNIDIDIFLALLKPGDTIIIQDATNSNNYQTWTVNGAETVYPNNYVTVPVALADSAGTGTTGFANNHNLIVVVIATGIQGPTGAQGVQGTTGTQGLTGTISPDDSWYYALVF